MRVLRSAAVWLLLCSLLSGCGGGGGGGDGGNNGFRVTLQTTSVSFDYMQGNSPAPQVIRASWTGEPPGSLFVAAVAEGAGIDPSIVIAIQGTSATAEVRPAANLSVGTHTGRILFLVCSDASCTQRVGGSPLPVSYTIDVRTPIFSAPPSLSFQYLYGTTPAGSGQVNVAANAGSWTATPSAPWIVLTKANGNGADTVVITYDPLAVPGGGGGSFTGNVVFTSAASTRTVPVTLAVTKPTLASSQTALTFVAVNGAPIATQAINITLSLGASLPLTISSDRPWLKYSAGGGNAPQTIAVNIDPSMGPLASGAYSGSLHIEAGNGTNNLSIDVPVALTLTPAQLTATPSSLVLGGNVGRNFDSVPLSLSLDTGTNAYAWTMTTPPNWTTTDRTSGVTSAAGQTVAFTPQRAHAAPGTTATTLRFTATVNGDVVVRDVPVSFNLDTHRLIAAENGVALVTTPSPSWRRLSHTVGIRSNFGLPVEWNATADADWLTVTPSGTAGNTLTLTANPTLPTLLPDGLHMATITVTSADDSISGSERIRVGLWVGQTVANRSSIWQGYPNSDYGSMIADPIRPYAYIHTGADIIVFNLYTQLVETTLANIAPDVDRSRVRAMAISSDGEKLYAYDGNDEVIVPIDLNTMTPLPPFPASNTNSSNPLTFIKYVRVNGVGLIMGRTEKAYLAETGAAFEGSIVGLLGAASDARHVFLHNMRIDIDFASVAGNTFVRSYNPSFAQVGELRIGDNGYTVANADGSRVYLAQERLMRYDGQTMTGQPSFEEPQVRFINAAVASSGVVAASSANFVSVNGQYLEDVYVYSPTGTVLTKFRADMVTPTGGPARHSLILSGDGFIVATGTQTETLEVVPVSP